MVATQEVTLFDGFRVRGPFGKCVDTRRTRQSAAASTVVLANCSNLGGRADIGAIDAALVLVTVMPTGHGDLGALRDALRAETEILSRSGQAADVELFSLSQSSVAVYANIADISAGGPEGVSPRHWKAALDVADHGVVISVFGESDGPLPGAAGESLARDVAQSLLEANSGLGSEPQSAPEPHASVESEPESAENTPTFVERLLGDG